MVDVNTAAEPVAGYVLVHRKVLNKLGISDSVVDTIAAQSASEQHEFNDESPFCVKCGSTGEDSVQPVAHILPRMLKILKFKSMPVPVDPLPYDNGEEKTVPLYTTPPATQAEPVIPAGFALVPIRATAAMVEAFSEEGWEWANVLAAAEAVTEGEYEAALEGTTPATQAALTAASDCRTCQHLSEAWGVCEARPKCVGGEQYVYFPEKQLWDKTPRNDGQAAHQEMREALYAEFNSAVGRQHD